VKKLRNETLVFLIRQTHRINDDLCGQMMEVLRKRVTGRVRRFCKGLDQVDREEVLLAVEMKVLELVLVNETSRRRDFLEIAFAQAVKSFTDDEREKLRNSPSGNVVDYAEGSCEDADDEQIERPIEYLPTEEPEPEEALLVLDNKKYRHRLLRKALAAVPDRRHREAVILHFGKNWPITSKKRGIDTLQRYFRKNPRQLKYWLDTAMKKMRDALGVQKITRRKSNDSARRGLPPASPTPAPVHHRVRSRMTGKTDRIAPSL
jgi:hypothetical protein